MQIGIHHSIVCVSAHIALRISLPLCQPVNCIFWPTLNWLVAASELHDRAPCCTTERSYCPFPCSVAYILHHMAKKYINSSCDAWGGGCPSTLDRLWLLDSLDTWDSMIVTKNREPNYCHYLLHHLPVQYLSTMFGIFMIGILALWIYDFACILQKYSRILNGGRHT